MYFIGIDIGTSATKLLLMDEKGSVLRLVQKTYPTCFRAGLERAESRELVEGRVRGHPRAARWL